MERVIVDFRNVSFSYGAVKVLEDVTIKVLEKDFLAIIGPNGGGKTTILRLILGLLEPDQGVITVLGKTPRESRGRIGYLAQNLNFDFDFPITVTDVVLMGRLGKHRTGQPYERLDREKCLEALDRVGMRGFKDRQIGRLSGGQRQRVFIARALATEPRILLLDEPVSSIDTQWQQSFYELLQNINKEIAIVLVTHDISVIATYIDKMACVNRKLYYHGSKKEGMVRLAELYECPVQLISHEPSRTEGPDHD
jgi:zinc transport system ATP-binding protein